ncbi:hypothetical protein BKA62DRAFT_477904 [Auriculariales sp. MPI-PUGE-AT-0066]|nr:hypothetical protein BKA62DRAFT_477904 [Auriculariales sp. MPI-PUGE-AT-0066]
MSASGSRKRPRRGGRDHDTASAGTVTPPSSPGSSRKRTRLLCESCPAITEYQYFLSHTGSGEPSQTNFGKPVYSLESTTADSGLHAIGYIQPHWNCDEDEEGDGEHPSQLIDEPTFVRLSSVLRVQISLGYIDKQYGLNGSHIWIETTFAYYYLLDPAINYVHIFAQWFRHAKAAQTVVAAVCCNPKITKPHFLSRLSELEHDQRIGENPLGEEDFEK